MKNITDMYLITSLTNMHVGSGDVNFDVIDNQIQRDVLTKLPNINSSGIKGALREYYKNYKDIQDDEVSENNTKFITIFGSSPKNNTTQTPGKFRFFDASLLSLPARSNKRTFLSATSPSVLQELIVKAEQFGIKNTLIEAIKAIAFLEPKNNKPLVFETDLNNSIIEDTDFVGTLHEGLSASNYTELTKYLGASIALLSDHDFELLCNNDNLPVIARNQLEDGRSNNLWYEQILPRYSRLYFMVMKGNNETENSEFEKVITEQPIQIGANASIGYGYSKLTKMI